MFAKFRDPFSGLSHLFAAIAAAIGLAVLLYLARGRLSISVALLIYGVCLMLMFGSSAAYHLPKARPAVLLFLRKLDHTAIYLMIAGTYTPICLHFFEGAWRWGILLTVWSMALIGVGVKIFIINAPRWLTAGVYLVMGWLAIVGVREMLISMPPAALAWLLAGGLFFTIGAIVYVFKRPNFAPGVFGFHELWHIFVILGALSHYILIAQFVAAG